MSLNIRNTHRKLDDLTPEKLEHNTSPSLARTKTISSAIDAIQDFVSELSIRSRSFSSHSSESSSAVLLSSPTTPSLTDDKISAAIAKSPILSKHSSASAELLDSKTAEHIQALIKNLAAEFDSDPKGFREVVRIRLFESLEMGDKGCLGEETLNEINILIDNDPLSAFYLAIFSQSHPLHREFVLRPLIVNSIKNGTVTPKDVNSLIYQNLEASGRSEDEIIAFYNRIYHRLTELRPLLLAKKIDATQLIRMGEDTFNTLVKLQDFLLSGNDEVMPLINYSYSDEVINALNKMHSLIQAHAIETSPYCYISIKNRPNSSDIETFIFLGLENGKLYGICPLKETKSLDDLLKIGKSRCLIMQYGVDVDAILQTRKEHLALLELSLKHKWDVSFETIKSTSLQLCEKIRSSFDADFSFNVINRKIFNKFIRFQELLLKWDLSCQSLLSCSSEELAIIQNFLKDKEDIDSSIIKTIHPKTLLKILKEHEDDPLLVSFNNESLRKLFWYQDLLEGYLSCKEILPSPIEIIEMYRLGVLMQWNLDFKVVKKLSSSTCNDYINSYPDNIIPIHPLVYELKAKRVIRADEDDPNLISNHKLLLYLLERSSMFIAPIEYMEACFFEDDGSVEFMKAVTARSALLFLSPKIRERYPLVFRYIKDLRHLIIAERLSYEKIKQLPIEALDLLATYSDEILKGSMSVEGILCSLSGEVAPS